MYKKIILKDYVKYETNISVTSLAKNQHGCTKKNEALQPRQQNFCQKDQEE
jgi:hypothetical protein